MFEKIKKMIKKIIRKTKKMLRIKLTSNEELEDAGFEVIENKTWAITYFDDDATEHDLFIDGSREDANDVVIDLREKGFEVYGPNEIYEPFWEEDIDREIIVCNDEMAKLPFSVMDKGNAEYTIWMEEDGGIKIEDIKRWELLNKKWCPTNADFYGYDDASGRIRKITFEWENKGEKKRTYEIEYPDYYDDLPF